MIPERPEQSIAKRPWTRCLSSFAVNSTAARSVGKFHQRCFGVEPDFRAGRRGIAPTAARRSRDERPGSRRSRWYCRSLPCGRPGAPQYTALPRFCGKPAASTASSTPTSASSLRALGGMDSARLCDRSVARATKEHAVSPQGEQPRETLPAGPPPIMIAS